VQAPGTNQSNKAYWSDRDLKLGEIVNELLKGEDIDVEQELFGRSNDQGGSGGDDDTAMEDADGGSADPDHHRAASGGAGANATGGDVREEGEESREGGADGGRA
jgi:26S proteasome regulatory subunit N13